MITENQTTIKRFTISVPIYLIDVIVSFGETDAEVKEYLTSIGLTKKEVKPSMLKDKSDGIALMYSNNNLLLRLKKLPETYYYLGVLHHEIFHVVTLIMNKLSMKFELYKSDEAYAYLLEYITVEVYKEINFLKL